MDAFVASAKRRNVDDNEAIALFDWSVEAYAVCGRNLPGYQHVVAKDVALDQLAPDTDGRSVTVTGVDDTTDGVRPAFRSVPAVAVCAVAPDGYEVVSRQSGTTSVKISSCPGDTIAYSAGFSKQDETGHTVISEAMLAQLVADPGRTAPSSTRITAKNVESLSENDLTAVTICAS
ncbi:hypothetical protein [Actinopolymorpha sp. B9G3]|uniref:hypothetical protein n=1 Tax=Actinopolymorpha sp. B9G3 TaxID=3158970 RepID=UPI0032D9870A